LFLTAQRLRLLQRERDRQSMRWQQFDALVPRRRDAEPGFAWALYYRVAKDAAAGKKAVDWASSEVTQNTAKTSAIGPWCSIGAGH